MKNCTAVKTGKHISMKAAQSCPKCRPVKLPSASVTNLADDNAMTLTHNDDGEFSLKHLSANNMKKILQEMKSPEVDLAIDLAEYCHAGQIRKTLRPNSTTNDDYIVHPLRNGLRCYKWTWDKDVLIIAILHDVVEDAPDRIPEFFNSQSSPIETIREAFGDRIANAVQGLTNDPNVEYTDHAIEQMMKNVDVFWGKLSDWKDNPGSLGYSTPGPGRLKLAKKYQPGVNRAYEVADYHFKDSPLRKEIAYQTLDEINTTIHSVIKKGS